MFEKHCTRASLRSDTVEDLIRISVGGGTRASLQSHTVEDLLRIGVEGQVWKMFNARESVVSWFIRGQRSRKLNYRSRPSEWHVTAMEDSP